MNKLVMGLGLAIGLVGIQAMGASDASAAQRCDAGRVWSSSLRQCIPNAAGPRVFIKHGCPYNLDKSCVKNAYGRLVNCRCVS